MNSIKSLKELREINEISIHKFVTDTGIARPTLIRIENGLTLNVNYVKLASQYFNVSKDYIVDLFLSSNPQIKLSYLKILRMKTGKTLVELSDIMGYNINFISIYETQSSNVLPMGVASLFAQVYKIDVSEIMNHYVILEDDMNEFRKGIGISSLSKARLLRDIDTLSKYKFKDINKLYTFCKGKVEEFFRIKKWKSEQIEIEKYKNDANLLIIYTTLILNTNVSFLLSKYEKEMGGK